MNRGASRRWAAWALVAVGYFVTAQLSLRVASIGSFSVLWPAAGVAFAALVVLGPRSWPAVAIGAGASAIVAGSPPVTVLGEIVANVAEPLVGVWIFRRLGISPTFDRVRDVALFAGPVMLAAALTGTAIGPLSFWLGGAVHSDALPLLFSMWAIGDGLGLLIVGPALLAARAGRFAALRQRPTEAALLFGVLALALLFLFTPLVDGASEGRPLSFLALPLLFWAALRFGTGGATAAILLTAIACAIGTTHGHGPFADYDLLVPRLIAAQLYLAVHALVAFLVAAADEERRTAIRLREDFLSAASHELKTPMTPLKVGVQLARQRLATGQLPSPDSLERVERQVDRLSRLIENLLDVSRITAGRMQLSLEEVDLGDVARDAVSGLGGTASQAGCGVTVQAEGPVVGRWDRLRVEQVVVNLLANAFKYAPGSPVEVTVQARDGVGRLRVRDHGGGIAAADRERIFRRFERGNFGGVGGLGLGLFIAREIVEALGGTIAVETEPGDGASFLVDLPLSPPERLLRGKLPAGGLLRRWGRDGGRVDGP